MDIITILGIFIGVLFLSVIIAAIGATLTYNPSKHPLIPKPKKKSPIGVSLKTTHQSDEEVRKVLVGLLPTKTKSKKKKVAKQ